VNGVVAVETTLAPAALLEVLHAVEARFGRVRRERNAARVLDLDLLAYDERVSAEGETPILPHPRLHERAFVLRPLAGIAPDWRHPRLGRTASALIADLPPDAKAEPMC
jgi:2-amino-4-hydroxy-6-hydroxymethyldihydropteridine diphosphokinase